MTKAKITAILITLTIAALFTNMQAQTTVDMALDRSEMLVGEQVRLTTTVNTDTKSRVEWPALLEGDTIQAGLEIVRREQPDTTYANEGKRITLKQTYLLTAFDSALYAIPPLEVIVNGQRIQARGRCGLKVIPIPVDTVHVDNFAPPYSSLEHPFTWSNSLLLTSLPLWILAILLIFFAIRISMFKPIQRRIVVPLLPLL